MSTVLAVALLFEAVTARFAAEGTEVPNVFGWREPTKHRTTTHRISWVPGDDGALGDMGPAKQPGRNPRSLGTLRELVTVYLEAQDASAPEDELAQYTATRLLYDTWWRAVYLAGRGTVAIEKQSWVTAKLERRYGAAIRVVLAVEGMVPDEAQPIAPLGVRGVVDVELEDVEEQVESGPAPPAARAATTVPITLSGEQTIDTVAIVADDRVLVKDQGDGAENGIYVAAAGAWSRAADELEHGFFVHVEEGAVAGDSGWQLTTDDPIVIDTTELTFERISP